VNIITCSRTNKICMLVLKVTNEAFAPLVCTTLDISLHICSRRRTGVGGGRTEEDAVKLVGIWESIFGIPGTRKGFPIDADVSCSFQRIELGLSNQPLHFFFQIYSLLGSGPFEERIEKSRPFS